MKCRIHDYPTRILVSSESESREDYLVDVAHPKVVLEDGSVLPNGHCGCLHFMCVLQKKLSDPTNHSIQRCKHIRAAREYLVDFLIPEMEKNDPNIREEYQA